jgi:hypothetical protein
VPSRDSKRPITQRGSYVVTCHSTRWNTDSVQHACIGRCCRAHQEANKAKRAFFCSSYRRSTKSVHWSLISSTCQEAQERKEGVLLPIVTLVDGARIRCIGHCCRSHQEIPSTQRRRSVVSLYSAEHEFGALVIGVEHIYLPVRRKEANANKALCCRFTGGHRGARIRWHSKDQKPEGPRCSSLTYDYICPIPREHYYN